MTTTARSTASATASKAVFAAARCSRQRRPAAQLRSQSIEKRAEACFACHGKNGDSHTALTPSLGAQPSFFVVAQLFLFRDNRHGKAATPMVESQGVLSDDDPAPGRVRLEAATAAAEKTADAARFARGPRDRRATALRVLPQPGFLRPRADAAARQSARGTTC